MVNRILQFFKRKTQTNARLMDLELKFESIRKEQDEIRQLLLHLNDKLTDMTTQMALLQTQTKKVGL
jgi:hypothetical protein